MLGATAASSPLSSVFKKKRTASLVKSEAFVFLLGAYLGIKKIPLTHLVKVTNLRSILQSLSHTQRNHFVGLVTLGASPECGDDGSEESQQ